MGVMTQVARTPLGPEGDRTRTRASVRNRTNDNLANGSALPSQRTNKRPRLAPPLPPARAPLQEYPIEDAIEESLFVSQNEDGDEDLNSEQHHDDFDFGSDDEPPPLEDAVPSIEEGTRAAELVPRGTRRDRAPTSRQAIVGEGSLSPLPSMFRQRRIYTYATRRRTHLPDEPVAEPRYSLRERQ